MPSHAAQDLNRRAHRLAFAAVILFSLARAEALPRMTPAEVAARANPSWLCTEYMIVGYCWCGSVPCGWQVIQYVPVAFIETTRSPGDTLVAALDTAQLALAPALAIEGHTRQINQSGMDNTFEAHVYEMPEHILQRLSFCWSCRISTARMPSPGGSSPGASANPCGDAAALAARLADAAGSSGGAWDGYVLALRYASEADALQWRTGCRDLGRVERLGAQGLLCSAAGLAAPDGAAGPGGPLDADACIGTWGPKYPRQMRTRGQDEIRSAAIAAYRAMSNARTDLGSFAYPVDTLGKLQQAYPGVSTCVRIGASPVLPPDFRRSADGAYGWIYWRPTLCCVPFDTASNC